MNGSSNRASGSSGKTRRKEVHFNLDSVERMLPLIRHIVAEITATTDRLARLEPELESLERDRRELTWAERRRRYQLQDEAAAAESSRAASLQELKHLGVKLVDRASGLVQFPTRINGREAFFSWMIGEESIGCWDYEGEDLRRPIPKGWTTGMPIRVRSV